MQVRLLPSALPSTIVKESEETVIKPNSHEDRNRIHTFIEWFVRRYYSDEIEQIKGDADAIYFERIAFDAEDYLVIQYSTVVEE